MNKMQGFRAPVREKPSYLVSLANIKLNTVRPINPEAEALYNKRSRRSATREMIEKGGGMRLQTKKKGNWCVELYKSRTRRTFNEMEKHEQKERIDELWQKLRNAVRMSALLRRLKL